ncbi:MAG TPA: hypothetical protein VKB67_05205 [Rhizomicrobium sp.]|nr:hypothetical protein [Rhizomicrobium sp.]
MRSRQFSSEGDIQRAAEKFLDRSLPKKEWTHAAHFAVTLWLIRNRPSLDLDEMLPDLIRAFNEATGTANTDSGGYHETITRASLSAARAYLAAHQRSALHQILEGLLASPLGDPGWLLEYWSRERLFSVTARRSWLPPDLKPLPYTLPQMMAVDR